MERLKISASCTILFFDSKTITVSKQFEIGTGKEFTATNIQSAGNSSACLIVREESSITWLTQNRPRVTEMESDIIIEHAENNESVEQGDTVFTCPEDGCIATFMKYGQLCLHLDRGNHVFPSDTSNLRERTKKSYSSLVETKLSSQKTLLDIGMSTRSGVSSLNQGWALKCKREVKNFSKEQISFMKNLTMGS